MRPAVTRAFLDLLTQQAPTADALYILGDFFEVWLGDDDTSALIEQVIAALRHCASDGTRIYIMHGNRDFLIGEVFCQKTGCTLLADPTVINLYGRQVLLAHGDALCTDDTDYMAFRQQCRSPQWQADLLSQPLAVRRQLAEQLRMQSKQANSNKAEDIMDVNSQAVQCLLNDYNTEVLIHGHTHRPAIHQLTVGDTLCQRIVLGDWDQHAWVLNYPADHNFELRQYPIVK
ncbi:UDP-2,3-diacylglucosamine diphosphatase [Oceanicoccus sp. KOV_DT_Chl]|uniref:UDP-2,3-diacylglucosamine diphosphatase n=1 Tax=Oceanicoccus sp. KOV_DT_Chl TaxID=1904639 RepID=UPI001F36F3B5|nr:UDP-2,3-diacylglucosamine diphosphatase [Oceanicoccus sp. KOV_DT_Chl]